MVDAPPPMLEGCPWSGFRQPNVNWCEAELCSWITNPADTWSNLAYIALALVMWLDARKRGSRTLAMFGPASFITGLFSFAYHASYTFFLQFFDFVGMFVFALLVVTLNLRRAGLLSARRQLLFYLGSVTLFSALVPPMFYMGLPIQSAGRLPHRGHPGTGGQAVVEYRAPRSVSGWRCCSWLRGRPARRSICRVSGAIHTTTGCKGTRRGTYSPRSVLYLLYRFFTQFDFDALDGDDVGSRD